VPLISPKKIYIVGPSGSGKTTLGKVLAQKFNLPHFDLDEIAYPNKQERSDKERLEEIEKLSKNSSWITEGIYVDWTQKLLERADLIVWLDLPYSKTFFRVIKRFIVHKVRGDETHGIKNTVKFIWNLRKYYYPDKGFEHGTEEKKTTRHKTKHYLTDYKEKIIRIKNDQKLKEFLSSIKN
jgi:adenylate kinase family enzyme